MISIDLKVVIPSIISAIAAFFAFLAYRRSRRISNENHLFEKKLEACSLILGKMSSIILNLETHFIKFNTLVNHPNSIDNDYMHDFDDDSDELQNKFDDFESFFASKSLLLPEVIIETIEKFSEQLYSIMIPYSDNQHAKGLLNTLEKGADNLVIIANEIDVSMRKDLKIDTLNHTLYRRLNK